MAKEVTVTIESLTRFQAPQMATIPFPEPAYYHEAQVRLGRKSYLARLYQDGATVVTCYGATSKPMRACPTRARILTAVQKAIH